MQALKVASQGRLQKEMLHFYKYLRIHGPKDDMPKIDKDLFFYFEAAKFKDCHHQYSDEETIRRKLQSIIDCYLQSSTPPEVQVDCTPELAQKSIRICGKYLTGKETRHDMFDEIQFQCLKELLPYWAGFVRKPDAQFDDRPLSTEEQERIAKLQAFLSWKPPSARAHPLPAIPKGSNMVTFTFTLTEGVKWKVSSMFSITT